MTDIAAHPAKPARPARATRQKVPPFARFKGTSAWRKDRRRAREYARFRAAGRQGVTDGGGVQA